MRLHVFTIALKMYKEQVREWPVLILTIITPAAFVLLYYLLFGQGQSGYKVFWVHPNISSNSKFAELEKQTLEYLKALKNNDGVALLEIMSTTNVPQAEQSVIKHQAYGILEWSVLEGGQTQLIWQPDVTHPQNAQLSLLISSAITQLNGVATKVKKSHLPTINWQIKTLRGAAKRTEFESYVPGLLVFSLLLTLLLTATQVVKEIENQNLIRYRMAQVAAWQLLSGVALVQVLIALLTLFCSYAMAHFLGFRFAGHFGWLFVIGILCAYGMACLGFLVSCLAQAENQVLTYSLVPLFLCMWFSGALYPIPFSSFSVGGLFNFSPAYLIPPSFAVNAMNQLVVYGFKGYELLPQFIPLLIWDLFLGVVSALAFKYKYFK